MATARDFVERVSQIEEVAGCLLVKNDGVLLEQTLDDPELYATLMQMGAREAADLMQTLGFSHCRYLCFGSRDNRDFYVFPIYHYFLGVIQQPGAEFSTLLEQVERLIERVSIKSASA